MNCFESKINKFILKRVPQYLSATLKINKNFNMIEAVDTVKQFIFIDMKFDEKDVEFLESFNEKNYKPYLLFDDNQIIDRVSNHPMANWKVNK